MRCMLVASARLAVVAAIAAAPRPARASPRDLVARPIALAPGELDARLVVELGLYKRAEPISFAPDVWFGVAPRWTLGVVHSAQSLGLIDDGATLCFRGRPPYGCDRAYNGSGVDVRWSWLAGPLAVAPRARFVLRDVEPWKPAVTAGALVRWTRGRFAVASDPYLRLGLANQGRGNRAALVLPLWLAVQPTCRWLVALHTGLDGELAILRDGWHGPIALAAEVRAASHLHLAVEAGFRSLLGPQQDLRSITAAIAIAWRPRAR